MPDEEGLLLDHIDFSLERAGLPGVQLAVDVSELYPEIVFHFSELLAFYSPVSAVVLSETVEHLPEHISERVAYFFDERVNEVLVSPVAGLLNTETRVHYFLDAGLNDLLAEFELGLRRAEKASLALRSRRRRLLTHGYFS